MERSDNANGRSKLKVRVGDFQSYDRRNFVKACNNVCFFENEDVELYFSIVDVGFFFKEYVLFALKRKKIVELYEVAITDFLITDGTLLPLGDIPSFSKIRRFNHNQKISGNKKRITLTFQDEESWKLNFKNRDMFQNWMDILKLAWMGESLSTSFVAKELKRNYDYMMWRTRHPEAASCLFGQLLDITATFEQEMKETKEYIGVNPDEIIGRYVCERRDKRKMQQRLQESQKVNNGYRKVLSEIQKSITTGVDC